jgi:predicted DNA-binding protein (UPF0251 family)
MIKKSFDYLQLYLLSKNDAVESFLLQMKAPKRKVEATNVPLTQGKLNAVRAAFKAGVTPSRIARQFGISQSDVRKALARDASKRSPHLFRSAKSR